MTQAVLALHGGAGTIARQRMTADKERAYTDAIAGILARGQALLAGGAAALDVVTQVVVLLEDCPLFNAGHGAVYTSAATHELDAAIMDGSTLAAGAVAGVRSVRNPVLAARAVMLDSPFVLLAGEGADAFARERRLALVGSDYFGTPERLEQLRRMQREGGMKLALDHDGADRVAQAAANSANAPLDPDSKHGTVGAVACDVHGHVAAASSTGGMTNKRPGRIGDTPVIGAGCYANDRTAAVAATGTGEAFLRGVAAYDVSALMEYAGLSLQQACERVIHEKMPALRGSGGLVAVNARGEVAMPFNTEGMYRGEVRPGSAPVVSIYR